MIYVSLDGEVSGPFEREKVEQILADRGMVENAFFWHEGLDEWLPLTNLSRSIKRAPQDDAQTPIAPDLSAHVAIDREQETLNVAANTTCEPPDGPQPLDPQEQRLKLEASALAFYSTLDSTPRANRIPFLLIDSKSLPRSGLHFLKQSLAKLFGDHFSFCEWYQEVGCCESMPCALTCFAAKARDTASLRVRLAKSHDFGLSDPAYNTGHYLRRLILLRQPLYTLTSWFALAQLQAHSTQLANHGIQMSKIYLLHEKEVVSAAYQCLDQHFKPPSKDSLIKWLSEKKQYCVAFLRKWVEPQIQDENPHVRILAYDSLVQYIGELFAEYAGFLGREKRDAATAALARLTTQFQPRITPFPTLSPNLSNYLQQQSELFRETADELATLPALQLALGDRESQKVNRIVFDPRDFKLDHRRDHLQRRSPKHSDLASDESPLAAKSAIS
jgi:hypothetical protein